MVLDTNLLIYSVKPGFDTLRQFIGQQPTFASVVSKVEALGFHLITVEEKVAIEYAFASTPLIPVSSTIIDSAIALRQQRKMSLGDALIGATALAYGLPLATHNVRDFDWIDGLNVVDPLVT